MREWITKELALKTLASHFDIFLRIADLLTCTTDAKRLPENRFFAAAVAVVAGVHSTQDSGVTLSQEAVSALLEYTNYYETMSALAEKHIGIWLHPEPDEDGLPQFTGDVAQIKKALQSMRESAENNSAK